MPALHGFIWRTIPPHHSYILFQISTVTKPRLFSIHASVAFGRLEQFKEMVGWMSCISHNVLRFAADSIVGNVSPIILDAHLTTTATQEIAMNGIMRLEILG